MAYEHEIKMNTQFQATIAEVAKILGWDKTDEYKDENIAYNNRATIEQLNGEKIFFRLDGDKVEISGIYDYGESRFGISFPRVAGRPSIKVSLSRGAEAIARDMERRFFPAYNEAVIKIQDMVKNYTDAYSKKDKMLEGVASLLGASLTEYSRRNYTVNSSYSDQRTRIEAKVSSYGIDLTLDSISLELAEKIIALVRNSQ
jgi:hypothetical protein